MAHNKKATGAGIPQVASKPSFCEQNYNTSPRIPVPPYGKRLNMKTDAHLVVCTGSNAWNKAKSPTWFSRRKVVLPLGADPAAFSWSAAAGHDVIIAGFGDLEPIGTIAKIGAILLGAGAGLVLYIPERGPITRIDARKEAA